MHTAHSAHVRQSNRLAPPYTGLCHPARWCNTRIVGPMRTRSDAEFDAKPQDMPWPSVPWLRCYRAATAVGCERAL